MTGHMVSIDISRQEMNWWRLIAISQVYMLYVPCHEWQILLLADAAIVC